MPVSKGGLPLRPTEETDVREPPEFVGWIGAIIGLAYLQFLQGLPLLWSVFAASVVGASSTFAVLYVYAAFHPAKGKTSPWAFCLLGTIFYVICDSGFGVALELLNLTLPWYLSLLLACVLGWIVGLHAVGSHIPPIRSTLLVSLLNHGARVIIITIFQTVEWLKLPEDMSAGGMVLGALISVLITGIGGALARFTPIKEGAVSKRTSRPHGLP